MGRLALLQRRALITTMQQLPLGTVIGGYRLEAVIGAGGMGCVYRAVHSKLGRKAAVKVLDESLARDPEYVSRFFHEARVVSAIGHPNIIDIYDFVEEESPRRVAYVMELVHGPSLAAVLKARRLSPGQSLNLALQIVDALVAVHAIQVVHRDLKPDNLLLVGSLDTDLSARPAVKILDFGIAKIQNAPTEHKTSTGMVLGTPAYMAPEQVAAEPVSGATDVYALGEILYEMIAGKRLFNGPNMAMLRSKLADRPPQVAFAPEVPGAQPLAELVQACLSLKPTERPALPELAARLAAVLELQPRHSPLAGGAHSHGGLEGVPAARLTPTGARATPTPFDDPAAGGASGPHGTLLRATHGERPAALAPPRPDRRALLAVLGLAAAAAGAALVVRGWQASMPPVVHAELGAPSAVAAAPRAQAQIASRPDGATVLDRETGVELGRTPLSVELSSPAARRRLRLEHPGHVAREIEVGATAAPVLVVLVAEDDGAMAPPREQAQPTADDHPTETRRVPATRPKGTPRDGEQPAPLKKGELPTW